jgi:hypothetical protein
VPPLSLGAKSLPLTTVTRRASEDSVGDLIGLVLRLCCKGVLLLELKR